MKLYFHPVVTGHVTIHTTATNCLRQPGMFATVSGLMTLLARAVNLRHVGWPMRIMTGHARQCLGLLETPALAQVLCLIRDVVVLDSRRQPRAEMGFERLVSPVTEGGTTRYHGVAMTLGAQVHLALAPETAWVDEAVPFLLTRMLAMIGNVFRSRTVTFFTSHSK